MCHPLCWSGQVDWAVRVKISPEIEYEYVSPLRSFARSSVEPEDGWAISKSGLWFLSLLAAIECKCQRCISAVLLFCREVSCVEHGSAPENRLTLYAGVGEVCSHEGGQGHEEQQRYNGQISYSFIHFWIMCNMPIYIYLILDIP